MESRGTSPRIVGRYALYEKVASGGMAAVHLGRLLGPVGFARVVAIKRLHTQYAEEPEFVAMFLDEARLAARINHPNVVATLDVVNVEGELFLVMEYIRGESLARLVRAKEDSGRTLPPEIASSILAGVLHGLHAAHEARGEHGEPLGIVHRDVSPHNILVGTDGVARVLDFGIAKAVGRLHTTRHGEVKGKLAYMAPEQIDGQPVDRRTDVYAASVVLWEALTGTRLFVGDNDGELLKKVLKGRIDPPSSRVAGLPAALVEVTLRGLSLDPADRFATARDMARALEDAVPSVVPSRIGEWVESVAREVLSEQSRLIDRIEADTAVKRAPAPGTPTRSATADSVPGPDETRTQLSKAAALAAPISRLRRARRRMASLAVGAAVLTGLVVTVAMTRRSRLSVAAAPTSQAPTPAVASEQQPPAPPPAQPPVSVASALPAASPSAPASPPTPRTRSGAAPSPGRPQPVKKPYSYDHM